MKRILSVALVLQLALPLAVFAAAERPVNIRGIRPLGMGDAFTALADDQNLFFYNPAGSTLRTGSLLTIIELNATIGKDLLDGYDFISDNEDKMSKFDELTPQQQADLINEIDRTISKLNPSFGVGLPNTNYVSGPMGSGWHWGTGLFGQVSGSFRLNADIVPSLDYDINADGMIPINIAKRFENVKHLPGKIGVGANLKLINRAQIKDDRVSFLQLEDFSSPQLQRGRGYGLDLGFLYQPNDRWSYGLANMDFLGTKIHYDQVDAEKGFTAKPKRTATIKPRWNFGAAWTPTKVTNNRLTLAADIKDFMNADNKVFFDDGFLADTAWTHVHLGAEYRWLCFRVRAGANQGYPTFGLGLDIPVLKLDYTYFSDELGRTAGTTKQTNHMLALALRFGSGKTEARDRIAGVSNSSAVDAPTPPPSQPAETGQAPAAEAAPTENAVPVEDATAQ